MSNKNIILIVVILVIVGGIFWIESGKNDARGGDGGDSVIEAEARTETIAQKSEKYERAKEISTPDAFINTEPLKIADLIGEKVILVDFWTYSCINCQRTLPYLTNWHEKYADDGLVILGIHTPEFEFEKKLENVQAAVDKFGIEYPVILDNDFSTWSAYRNRYWPRKYLIDIDGFIIYDHIGEGAYEETEKVIVEALKERKERLGEGGEITADGNVSGEEVDFRQIETPEIYFGSSRIEYIANMPTPNLNGEVIDVERPRHIPDNYFAFDGRWRILEEEARLVGSEGSIFLNFKANKVNFVASSEEGVEAEIYLDGELVDEFSGSDVVDGVVEINEANLYNLIDLGGKYEEHELEIRVKNNPSEGGLEAFTFTFG